MKAILTILFFTMLTPVIAMDYYDFTIDGRKAGYYEQEDKDGILYQNAFIEMDKERFENPFWVKHDHGKVLAYRYSDKAWVDLATFPANTFPTSAFELVAADLKDGERLTYRRLTEGTGAVQENVVIERQGNRVTELIDGKPGRYDILDEQGRVLEFGWGGNAKSVRVPTKAEAVQGTVFNRLLKNPITPLGHP